MIKGTLYGVGVGPGDPRLMTYLAVDTIRKCPVIAVPADGKENAVSYKIASGIVENLDEKECLNLTTPMTKDRAAGTGEGCCLPHARRSDDLQYLYLYPSDCKSTWLCN